MTEQSGMSRRQALRYGGLAAALPLLGAARPAKEASAGGSSSHPQRVAPAQLALAADEAGDVRAGRAGRGAGHMRCQLQFPSVRDRVDLDGDDYPSTTPQTANVNQTANVISEGSHGQ